MSITSRSSSRNGQRVIWLTVHTSEGGGTARQLRDADWWVGSSHAICDNTELLTPAEGCVPYDRASWTLRDGNGRSENIEQIGYAKWTRDYWLSERMPQLRHTARWLGDRAAARGLPLDYIGIPGVQANRAGVIQHNDYSKGTGDGTHWDCGPGYPIDVVIDMARGAQPTGDDMTPDQERKLDQIWAMAQQNAHGVSGGWGAGANLLAELAFRNQVLTELQTDDGPVDVEALAASLAPLLVPAITTAVGDAGGLSADKVEEITEKALRDVLGSLAEPG